MKSKWIFLLVILSLSSCREGIDLDCADVYCYAIFHEYSVTVVDVMGKPVALDKYITMRERKNLEIDIQSRLDPETDNLKKTLGIYPVLNDSHVDLIKYENEKFIFKGYKKGELIVKANYIFTSGCCGIVYVSGPQELEIE